MTQEHPIISTPELVKQWWKDAQQADYSDGLPCWLNYVATQAARWGADQELEACCQWLAPATPDFYISALRAARRPKPPSLKEQALDDLHIAVDRGCLSEGQADTIRRALEELPDD